jgi:trimeric autotransporter adhesin
VGAHKLRPHVGLVIGGKGARFAALAAVFAAVAVATIVAVTRADTSVPAVPDATSWITNGDVSAVLHAGGKTYLAGQFDYVGPPTGSGVVVDPTSGKVQSGFAAVAGRQGVSAVQAAVPDGSGGYFIGGTFDSVGGFQRPGLAHILASGTVDQSFDPAIISNSGIESLAISPDFKRLYVGGFLSIQAGSTKLIDLVALNTATGQPIASFDPQPDSDVSRMALSPDGGTLYAAGAFSHIGSQASQPTINELAKLNTSTGAADTSFDPEPNSDVSDLALSHDGNRLYVVGAFNQIGGQAVDDAAALNPADGSVDTSWDPGPDTQVNALAVSADGSTIYLAGQFTSLTPDGGATGYTRNGIAAVNSSNGAPTGWNPAPTSQGTPGIVDSLSLDGSTLLVAGRFDHIGGAARRMAAALSTTTGAATSFDPHPSAEPDVFVPSASRIYMGGVFDSVGGVDRAGIAQLDSFGRATSWDPRLTPPPGPTPVGVKALAISRDGQTLYAAGDFDHAGAVTRNGLAGLSVSTAAPNAFNPVASATAGAQVNQIDVSPDGNTLYAAGDWGASTIDGFQNLVAMKASDGSAASGWSPATAYSPVGNLGVASMAMSPDGSKLYLGGSFIAGGHSELAAVSASNGTLDTTFAPLTPDRQVYAVRVSPDGSTLYVGGLFLKFGAVVRPYIAALDPGTGAIRDWEPDADATVRAIALSPDGRTVYIGGDFTSVGAQPSNSTPIRPYLAAIDAGNGYAAPFAADFRDYVDALDATSSGLYVGGRFSQIGDKLSGHYAQFTGAPVNLTPPKITVNGRLLTCQPGTWSGEPGTFTYAWTRDGLPIYGASSSTYTVTSADELHAIVCTVTASNGGGSASASSAAYRPPDRTPPTVTGFEFQPSKFAVKGTRKHKHSRPAHRGSTIHFTLSEAGSVRITIGHHTLTFTGRAGANADAFSGRVGGRALAPGSYKASLVATDRAGNASKPVTTTFKIVRG